MNVVVLSPNGRGQGVTSVAYTLAIELKHRGEFVQLMDVNGQRPSLMNLYKMLPNYEEKQLDGMKNMYQLIRTGTINAEDMANCAIDLGVYAICVTPDIDTAEIADITSITKSAKIGGRDLYTVIDMNIDDVSNPLFKEIIKSADICVFVLTQDQESFINTKNAISLNEKEMLSHGIRTCYVVNKFEENAASLKNIWTLLNVKNTKNWFKLRYNETIPQVKSTGLFIQYAKALHESADTDVARIKTDISRIASYVVARHS